MTTKQQEREALEKILKIVEGLGDDSYIGTAMTGVWSIAEQNIEFDAAFNLAEELVMCRKECEFAKKEYESVKREATEIAEKVRRLEAELEREKEWQPHESDRNVKQADYENLANAGGTRTLTDDEAKQLIADEFGFNSAKITILHSVYKEEINRHHQCRRVGDIPREPVYNATDWNYIRFDCAGWYYEMHNGSLSQYYC